MIDATTKDCENRTKQDQPSNVLLILVSGNLASRSSSTISVRDSSVGNMFWNCAMWPGYHDGGVGSAGKAKRAAVLRAIAFDRLFERMGRRYFEQPAQ